MGKQSPDYATNAPQGYMGDWNRGAPLGRPTRAPDRRTASELEADFAHACKRLSDALRLKEDRPADGFKARCWEAAAQSAREDKEELRALHKAALERISTPTPKITLQRIRLDSGGYDPQGAYFGLGQPIYWAACAELDLDMTMRARDRADAKEQVRALYPLATFYR